MAEAGPYSEEILDHEPENLTYQIGSKYIIQPVQNLKCDGKKYKVDLPDEFELTTKHAPYVLYSHTESAGQYREERYVQNHHSTENHPSAGETHQKLSYLI